MNPLDSLAKRWPALLALALGALVFALPAQADPPGRIGRIAFTAGTVLMNDANTGDTFNAPLNQPLTSGDVLSTGPGARGEVQIGSLTIRLDGDSRLEVLQIDDEQIHLALAEGSAIAKFWAPDAVPDFVLDTRNGRFTARQAGVYRFDTDPVSSSGSVYGGTLHFAAADSEIDINQGQTAQFWQDPLPPGQTRYRSTAAVGDAFSQWSAARDQRAAATSTYTHYVSPEMTGAADLDDYGDWATTPQYGVVWYPRTVPVGWAPYRTGHWAWVAPWGWSWVGNEPWGFAPFHYGRWTQVGGRWGWLPGQRVVRPVYSPAMVAWIGSPGGNVAVGIGRSANVGWFPLGPREVYVPTYRSSATYVRAVNVTHVSNISNVTTIVNNPQQALRDMHYANRAIPQALTAVPADVISQRRPVAASMLSARDSETLRQQPTQAAVPVPAPRLMQQPVDAPRGQPRPEFGGTHPDAANGRPPSGDVRPEPIAVPGSAGGRPPFRPEAAGARPEAGSAPANATGARPAFGGTRPDAVPERPDFAGARGRPEGVRPETQGQSARPEPAPRQPPVEVRPPAPAPIAPPAPPPREIRVPERVPERVPASEVPSARPAPDVRFEAPRQARPQVQPEVRSAPPPREVHNEPPRPEARPQPQARPAEAQRPEGRPQEHPAEAPHPQERPNRPEEGHERH